MPSKGTCTVSLTNLYGNGSLATFQIHEQWITRSLVILTEGHIPYSSSIMPSLKVSTHTKMHIQPRLVHCCLVCSFLNAETIVACCTYTKRGKLYENFGTAPGITYVTTADVAVHEQLSILSMAPVSSPMHVHCILYLPIHVCNMYEHKVEYKINYINHPDGHCMYSLHSHFGNLHK